MVDSVELTNAQLITAVTAYAAGKTSGQIIDDLIAEFALEDTPENRENLRNQLRSANPNDKRFALTKYGSHYELAREAMLDVLREKARDIFDVALGSISAGLEDIPNIEASLHSIIDNASDNDVTSNTEYLNTIRTLMSCQKVKIEGINAIANLIDTMKKAVPIPASPSENGKH